MQRPMIPVVLAVLMGNIRLLLPAASACLEVKDAVHFNEL